MTNETLSHVLRRINVSKGHSVRKVDDMEAVLIENHKTVETGIGGKYAHLRDYLILMKGGKKAGILLKCDSADIHAYVYDKYREQHILSRLTNNGFLAKLWPDIKSVTCADSSQREKIEHIVKNAGLRLRGKYDPIY